MTNTSHLTVTKNDLDQRQADEQLRKAILEKRQAQIDAWSRQVETLQEGLKDGASNVRQATDKHLDDLSAAVDQARRQLDALQQATQDTWSSMLKQSDDVFQGLADRFHAFTQDQN